MKFKNKRKQININADMLNSQKKQITPGKLRLVDSNDLTAKSFVIFCIGFARVCPFRNQDLVQVL
jgi:hypothetical protein